MDWRSVAFDWNRARAFLVTAEEGSFSAAARALGVAQPTLGRQVAALEEELGVTLFERVGNTLTPTAAGLDLLDHVRAMGEAATRVSLTAAGQSESIEGTVRIAASEAISAYLLPPIIAELRREHPGIELELVVSNQPSDLRRREADIAIRNFRPTEPDLVTRKLRDSRAWLYGAPSYLERIGNPSTPAEVSARAEIIAFEFSDRYAAVLEPLGFSVGPRTFPVRTMNHLVQWELTKQGVGLNLMMEEVGDAEPRVRRVLPDHPPIATFPSWLTCHRELRTSRRIRVVFDWLARALGDPSEGD
jgi:DNA-binding transcriptional LysR family regulator